MESEDELGDELMPGCACRIGCGFTVALEWKGVEKGIIGGIYCGLMVGDV